MAHVFPPFPQIKITTNQSGYPTKTLPSLNTWLVTLLHEASSFPLYWAWMICSNIEIVSTNKLMFMLLRCNISAQGSVAFLQNPFFQLKNNILRESSFYQLGQSPKILRPKPHGLERTDSQTIGDFATRRKGMYFSTACWMGYWEFIYFVMVFFLKSKGEEPKYHCCCK